MVPNTQPEIIDLTIGPNCDVHDVDNAKVVGLDHVAYSATRLSWQTNEVPEMASTPGTTLPPVSGNEPGKYMHWGWGGSLSRARMSCTCWSTCAIWKDRVGRSIPFGLFCP